MPNVAIVRPGADGAADHRAVSARAAPPNVLVDVFGWFSTSTYTGTDGARLIPIDPVTHPRHPRRHRPARCRRRSAAGRPIDLQIRGVDGVSPAVTDVVPDSPDVTGVLLNVVGITDRARRHRDALRRCSPTTIRPAQPDDVQPQPRGQRRSRPTW